MDMGLMEYLELELKYCERCGTLRLRTQGSSQVYCESCAEEMAKVFRVAISGQKTEVLATVADAAMEPGCEGRRL